MKEMIDIAHFADVIHSLEYAHFIRNGRYASTLNQTRYSSIEIQNGEKTKMLSAHYSLP